MRKLSEVGAVLALPPSWWRSCGGCDDLFPAGPEEFYCRRCVTGWQERNRGRRCEAAHPADCSACEGPRYAVRIVDGAGSVASGCVRHGAVLLASLAGGRVYPGSVAGAAIEVFRRASHMRPFTIGCRCGGGGRR